MAVAGAFSCRLLGGTLLFSDARREAINTMLIPNSVVPSDKEGSLQL